MKVNFENSLVPHPGFEPRPSAQQAGVLPLDHSADVMRRLGVWHISYSFRFVQGLLLASAQKTEYNIEQHV